MSSIEEFERCGLIANGGFGDVYLARDKKKRFFAVKVFMRATVPMDVFRREARIMARLHHPNILKLHRFFIDETKAYMVMDFMVDGSVKNYLEKQEAPLEEPKAKNIVSQMLAGVSYLHGQAIVHCNIKPSNLLMDRSGVVKVANFATAVEIIDGKPEDGHPVSHIFTAPEVFQQHSFASDMWSVAITTLVIVCSPEQVDSVDPGEMQGQIPARASPALRDLLAALLQVYPASRLSAQQALAHDWLAQ